MADWQLVNQEHDVASMMSLNQAATWISCSEKLRSDDVLFSRVHTDTRTVLDGDFFIALTGEQFNGDDFLVIAREQGAVAALCSSKSKLQQSGLPGLVVADTRKALGELATSWRSQFKLPMIAVAGSNGKTTVTQMIASILRQEKPQSTLSTQGNLNNEIGVPLTLLRLNSTHQVAVVEVGMNHPGEIAMLAAMVRPTVALVNNAQREHLEFMKTVDAVAQENAAVIRALPADGVAVFPISDDFSALWKEVAGQRPTLTFGISSDVASDPISQIVDRASADILCTQSVWSENAWHIHAQTPSGAIQFKLKVPGRHNVQNAMAATACALAAGSSLAAVQRGLEYFEPVTGRSRSSLGSAGGHQYTLIDDTYNANPDSVRAAIDVLAGLPGPRLLILGDMGEVGAKGPEFHAEAGEYAKSLGIENLFTLGNLAAHASGSFQHGNHFLDLHQLVEALPESLSVCGSILVKGSRFMKMERVIDAITRLSESASSREIKCS